MRAFPPVLRGGPPRCGEVPEGGGPRVQYWLETRKDLPCASDQQQSRSTRRVRNAGRKPSFLTRCAPNAEPSFLPARPCPAPLARLAPRALPVLPAPRRLPAPRVPLPRLALPAPRRLPATRQRLRTATVRLPQGNCEARLESSRASSLFRAYARRGWGLRMPRAGILRASESGFVAFGDCVRCGRGSKPSFSRE